jgi:ankyrin repeat protein
MNGRDELFQAVQQGAADSVRALLDADPSLVSAKNDRGQSAVLAAAYAGRGEIRDLLIARGAPLGAHEAAAAGKLARVQELVESGAASAGDYSPDGFPLLALAAAFGHEDVARYLHGEGADLNAAATNGTGYTALTGAVTNGHESVVRWLLENGADANYRYGPGYTPLHAAAANGHLPIVKLLLAHGADASAGTNEGKTPLALATERKHTTVADYLRALPSKDAASGAV